MAIDKITSASITTDAVGPTQLNEAANYAFTGTVTGAGEANTPAWFANKTDTTSVATTTTTKATFNVEIVDTDNGDGLLEISPVFSRSQGGGGLSEHQRRNLLATPPRGPLTRLTI